GGPMFARLHFHEGPLWPAAAAIVSILAAPVAWCQEDEESAPQPDVDPRIVEVRFTDDSRLKVLLADERIEIESIHGKLSIPAGDVRVIEFASRWTAEQKQEVERWIAELGCDDPSARETAAGHLLAHPDRTYAALVQATRSGTPALIEQAEELLKQLREEFSPAELAARDLDMVQTDDTKIAGHLLNPVIKLKTSQFGTLDMKLADARSLRSLAFVELPERDDAPDPKGALPDPGNLKSYEGQIGKVFLFKVTGGAGGSLWGTGTYTTDSNLAAAAVHSGILKMGETGIVQVKVIASPPSFAGSVQNGLASSGYGVYGGAYEVSKPKAKRRGR
ncbi:MAG: LCCL domain-containing protein, partial [Pirellulaceae bacterium]